MKANELDSTEVLRKHAKKKTIDNILMYVAQKHIDQTEIKLVKDLINVISMSRIIDTEIQK